jgi:hypothetical protein
MANLVPTHTTFSAVMFALTPRQAETRVRIAMCPAVQAAANTGGNIGALVTRFAR